MKIHIKVPYQLEVEMDIAQINAGLENGDIPPDALGWRPGMTDWVNLKHFPEIKISGGRIYPVAQLEPPPVPALRQNFSFENEKVNEYGNLQIEIRNSPNHFYTVKEITQFSEPHIWRRFFARTLDYGVFSMLTFLVPFIWKGYSPESRTDPAYIIPMLFIYVFFEAFLMWRFGTTLGKFILKIQILPQWGSSKQVFFGTAFRRSLSVWARGVGAGIPLISQICLLFWAFKLPKYKITLWDWKYNYAVRCYNIEWQHKVLAGSIIFITWLLITLSWMPHHSGDAAPSRAPVGKPRPHSTPAHTLGASSQTQSAIIYDLKALTEGMIVGRAQDDELYDIAFPGDMRPNVDVITAQGKSAQIVYGIRIADNEPIMMLKLVHFSQVAPLGVQQITATSGNKSATHRFPSNMVSRQTVPRGTIEFATMLPYVEPSAGRFLDVTQDSKAYNVEVKGDGGFTTFSPGSTAREHASRMLALFSALKQRPELVTDIQRNALSFEAFQQQALLQGL